MVQKVIENGKVAVLVSPKYGAGWSSWAYSRDEENILLFDHRLVQACKDGVTDIDSIIDNIFGKNSKPYTGGWQDIKIEWVTEGSQFIINEYDGYERLEIQYNDCHVA